jgi:hypothetical protein
LAKRPIGCTDFVNRLEDYVLVSIQGGGKRVRPAYLGLSKNQRLTELCSKIDAGGDGGRTPEQNEMKPRTVYEKAVQDFIETARQLARLNQHFRQASFAEFEMLMGLDDEVLKRYGLPTPMVDRALLEAYQTVVLGQQRNRDHS